MYIGPPFIKKIEANVEGRDFVVGDLHGCYDDLINLLRYVKFNPKKDRLFSTGDLIDRGPKPFESISLLNKEWFYPVLGNHEDIFLSKMKMLESNRWQQFSPQEVSLLQKAGVYEEYIYNLPLVYEIEHLIHNKVYIVHAEILPEHIIPELQGDSSEEYSNEYNKVLEAMNKFDFSNQIEKFFNSPRSQQQLDYSLKQKLIWSRKIISKFYNDHKKTIEDGDFSFLEEHKFEQKIKIFCGHNIVPFPMKIGQQYYIDTGATLGHSSKEVHADLFSQFGNEFFALSMVDITSGVCYGSITSQENRGEIMKLEYSLYD